MLEILQFVCSGFWTFCGSIIVLAMFGEFFTSLFKVYRRNPQP
jgi:hypothetical protein